MWYKITENRTFKSDHKQRESFLFGVSLLPLGIFETSIQVAEAAAATPPPWAPPADSCRELAAAARWDLETPRRRGLWFVWLLQLLTYILYQTFQEVGLVHNMACNTLTVVKQGEVKCFQHSRPFDPSNHKINMKHNFRSRDLNYYYSTIVILVSSCVRKCVFPVISIHSVFLCSDMCVWLWGVGVYCTWPHTHTHTHTHTLFFPPSLHQSLQDSFGQEDLMRR